MALPYQLYGGATRPDALNFNPGFASALQALYDSAPPEVQREMGLTSGYRDRAVQERLFNASDKTGHNVARPGHSKHESGNAADLYGFGTGGGKVSDATKQWVHANASKHGLYFPMSYEPWHIQYRGDGSAAPADASLGATLAGGVNPELAAALTQARQPSPTLTPVTDAAPSQRGGLVGEGSAGAPTEQVADPGIPPLETAALLKAPLANTPTALPPQALASLFKVKDIGTTAPLPTRRF